MVYNSLFFSCLRNDFYEKDCTSYEYLQFLDFSGRKFYPVFFFFFVLRLQLTNLKFKTVDPLKTVDLEKKMSTSDTYIILAVDK